jgi:hypothetical protein
MTLSYLQKNYPKFIYQSFGWRLLNNKNLEINFEFIIEPDIFFKPKVLIKKIPISAIKKLGEKTLDNLVFHLGLIESLSYWKATCSPKIIIKAAALDLKQKKWWLKIIERGMGQFFYENKINPKNFLPQIITQKTNNFERAPVIKNQEKIILPFGGGKDSILSLEILKKSNKKILPFISNPIKAHFKILKKAGLEKNILLVERKIDPKLLELNKKGFLNGHTPYSAYLAFLSFLVAALNSARFIILSNERSSEESNLKYFNQEINHQWSKTFEFEKMFRQYSKKYLIKNIEYFSLLRVFEEIQIAQLFSYFPQYFNEFISCNQVFKQKTKKRWCLKCPKCLSTYILLSAFLAPQKLIKIFGKDLLKDKSLKSLLELLILKEKPKPFECVGTKNELKIALFGLLNYYEKKKWLKMPFLLKYFKNKISKSAKNQPIIPKINFQGKNCLPLEFKKLLKKEIKKMAPSLL